MFVVPRDVQYATSFPLTENPIFENGKWIGGATVGIDWSNLRSVPGQTYGTQDGNQGVGVYNDSIAALAGPFPADQVVQFTVKIANQKGGTDCYEELAGYLRLAITPHRITGYECGFRCVPGSDGSRYCGTTRWNGPIGDFTSYDPGTLGPGLVDGDVVRAGIIGDLITVKVNGVVAWTHDCSGDTANSQGVSKFTAGSPGMGHWLRNGTTTGNASDYYINSWMARPL